MLDRRQFLQHASALTISAATPNLLQTAQATDGTFLRQTTPAKDAAPVRIGVIGAGSRGLEDTRHLLRTPGVRVVAAADVYPPRFEQMNQACGYSVAAHTDYRQLLDRKDIDAVLVATPLGLHAEHVLAALDSGRHVYGEKAMAYTAEEASAVVKATERSKRIFQIGHQYRYSPWIRAAIARVHQGEIGQVTHIHGYWNRNGNWRRPVPQPDPDGKLEHLLNWRLYHRWSLGLFAELGSHHTDVANWIFGSMPVEAIASGSICCYHDGRETDDNVQAVLSYSEGRRFIFTSMTDNANFGNQLWVYGTKGSLNVTLADATFFYERSTSIPVSAAQAKDAAVAGASYRASGEMPYRGPGLPVHIDSPEDATTVAARAFIHCVRTGERPIADEHVGYGSALGIIRASEARYAHKAVAISAG